MKKIFSILCVFFCLTCFSSCSNSEALRLRGNLFDEQVLQKYSLSFLQKPENATNERQYIYKQTYVYQALMESAEAVDLYAQSVLEAMQENLPYVGTTKPYAGANSVDGNDVYYLLFENEPLEEYKNIQRTDGLYGYLMYYSGNEKTKYYDEKKGGKRLQDAACLTISLNAKKNGEKKDFWVFVTLWEMTDVYVKSEKA